MKNERGIAVEPCAQDIKSFNIVSTKPTSKKDICKDAENLNWFLGLIAKVDIVEDVNEINEFTVKLLSTDSERFLCENARPRYVCRLGCGKSYCCTKARRGKT